MLFILYVAFLSKELASLFSISSLPVITISSKTIFMQVQLLNNKKNRRRPKNFLLGKKTFLFTNNKCLGFW